MRLSEIDPWERPRERLATEGASALAERELLALVLRSGVAGSGALVVADALLAEFGGVRGLARAALEELADVPGVGTAKAASLLAAFELCRRQGRSGGSPGRSVKDPRDLVEIVRPRLAQQRREMVDVVILDARNRVRRVSRVSSGAVDRAPIPVREILHAVLRQDGAAFAVAHNHPSGSVRPSSSDVESTKELIRAAESVNLRFVDHLIISEEGWLSLRQSGCWG